MENLHKEFDQNMNSGVGEGVEKTDPSADKDVEHAGEDVYKPSDMFDHLESPDLAIQTCIGSLETHQRDLPEKFYNLLFTKDFNDPSIDNIDFSSSCEKKQERGQLSGGGRTYVISELNDKDKFSSGYYHCTGIIAVGKDKETGQNISFASHCPLYSQNSLNNPTFKKLQSDLLDNLIKLKLMSEEGTVDAVVFGGIVIEDLEQYKGDAKKYEFMMNLYQSTISTSLGFSPISVGGPKPDLTLTGTDNMYFDNQTRRLYLLRPRFSEKVSALPKKL